MSDQRCFENPFGDYSGEETFIDVSNGQLKTEIRQKLVDNISKLLRHLSNSVKKDTTCNDYTVYTGIAGYAYLYLQLADAMPENGPTYLNEALMFAEKALRMSKSAKSTFLCGSTGPTAVAAVVYHKCVQNKSAELIKQLSKIEVSRESYDEMLYGRSGILYSLLFVNQYIPEAIPSTTIRPILELILKSGQKTAHKDNRKSPPLYYYWHDKDYIGAAHGFVGILCLLLECRNLLTDDEIRTLVKPSVDHIFKYRLKSGNYMSSAGSTSDRLVQWCHGAPGVVYLFALAYQAFGDEKYLDEALSCGNLIWKRGLLTKGYGICHGTAGNGYPFLRLYQITKDEKHLYRALKFADWCCDYGQHGCRTPDRPLSLFEGLAGTLYFLSDLLNPQNSRFPAFQLSV